MITVEDFIKTWGHESQEDHGGMLETILNIRIPKHEFHDYLRELLSEIEKHEYSHNAPSAVSVANIRKVFKAIGVEA